MIPADELRPGNIVLWNPKTAHPQTTLRPVPIEVTAVESNGVRYSSPNFEHRVEPFEDDKLQTEGLFKPFAELEPIGLTEDILESLGFQKTGDHLFLLSNLRLSREPDGLFRLQEESGRTLEASQLHRLQNHFADIRGAALPLEDLQISGWADLEQE